MINSDQTGTVYAGSSLTLSCVVSLDLAVVDTPTNAIITWDTPSIEKTESHTISNTTGYVSSNISVGPLADDRDNGDYHCTVSLTTDYEYLLGTERVELIALDITSKLSVIHTRFPSFKHNILPRSSSFDSEYSNIWAATYKTEI